MTGKISVFVIALMFIAVTFGGCKKEEDASAVNTVKTAEDYRTEAEKEIDETNLDSELDKLEKELQADIEADSE